NMVAAPPITVNATFPPIACFGGTTTLTPIGAGGVSYPPAYTSTLTYQINGAPVAASYGPGTYTITATDYKGCTGTNVVTITAPTAPITTAISVTSCDTYTWTANSTTYTNSGVYTATLLSVNACDSIVTMTLTINNASVNTPTSATACNSYTWSANSLSYTSSGTYTATFLNAANCDSTVILNLTINNSSINPPTNASSCSAYTWAVDGNTYIASGTYTSTYLNALGCDSSYTLNLVINEPSVNNPTNATACSEYTWSVNGQVYTASGTYIATYLNAAGCDSSHTLNLTISATGDISNTTAGNATSVAGSGCHAQNQLDGTTVSYYDLTCKLIATVQDASGGNILGNVNACAIVTPTVPVYNAQPYFARYYTINASAGPANLTLYLTQDDFNDYNANAGTYPQIPVPTAPINGSTATLCISQVPQTTLPGAPGANTTVHSVTAVWNAAAARWEVNFPVVGFGGFYFHACTGVPLPATVTSFTGFKANAKDVLQWTTSSEQNNAYFNLEHSTDGTNFKLLNKVNSKAIGGNSSTSLNYSSENLNPSIGHNYYRLQQVDLNGTTSYESQIVDLVWLSDGNTVSIYPNPSTDILNIDLYTAKSANIVVKVLDMSGRTVKQVIAKSNSGMNNLTVSLNELASGLYTVQILENNKLSFVEKVRKSD
ncbi:MAG TPA: T9SS type A sorting domain-containing protein, partial [Chitinophagaceae bacterium]|nr:T9SS type A sorting domain-containing protein [Chitinophagaceae bacterium]